jgi:hypothetical protein
MINHTVRERIPVIRPVFMVRPKYVGSKSSLSHEGRFRPHLSWPICGGKIQKCIECQIVANLSRKNQNPFFVLTMLMP